MFGVNTSQLENDSKMWTKLWYIEHIASEM